MNTPHAEHKASMDKCYAGVIDHRRESQNFRAYYYSFNPTGVVEIDDILLAVAAAGKACHNTDCWGDPVVLDDPFAPDYVDIIQEAADRAAKVVNSRPTRTEQ